MKGREGRSYSGMVLVLIPSKLKSPIRVDLSSSRIRKQSFRDHQR